MKETISVLLVLALSLCMGITAFAEEIVTNGGKASTNVKATYVPDNDNTGTVYSVDVDWGSMEFTYTTSGAIWDPENHLYTGGTAAWSCAQDANKITVTNHSNTAVQVSLAYTSGDNFKGAIGTFGENNNSFPLSTAAGKSLGEADTQSRFLTFSGDLSYGLGKPTTIGSVTVTINGIN